MGMLFRTPDTADVLAALNDAFSEDNLATLAKDAKLIQWFGTGGGKKKLWQISSQLGIWPKKTLRGKGRWFTFLKSYLPTAQEDTIKLLICQVLTNPANFQCIRFDAAEDTAYSVVATDLPVPSSGKNVRLITLFTIAMPASDKGDSTDDP
jgi:hypothetical protein